MTTDVSINPRGTRVSATWCHVLIDQRVDILPKAAANDLRRSSESGQDGLGRDEDALTKGTQLTDGHSIPGHEERSPFVEVPHDSPAVVAQLSLRDSSAHDQL